MLNKWMIMFAGIGTVFAALISIILMLLVFQVLFSKRKEKKRPELAPIPEVFSAIAPTAPAAAPRVDGGELVAVITAAISAAAGEATGAAASAFRIASISPSAECDNGFNTPIWGRIERFAQK